MTKLVLRTFAAVPWLTATGWAVVFLGWIVAGTILVDPIADSATTEFIRDGVVRWPGALAALVLLIALRGRLGVDVIGRPVAPSWFPWATIVLAAVALVRLSVVSQFWSDGRYTIATFFSEMSTGVFEELAFRGLIFGGLVYGFGATVGGVRKATILTTVLFGLAHVTGGWAAIIVTLLFGAVFLMSTIELRSLWPAAVFHGLFDVGVNGSVPVGEEEWNGALMGAASLALLIAGLVALVMFMRWKEWPVSPQTPGNSDQNLPQMG